MTKWLAVSAILLSQAVWIYAQNGLVVCVHADGEVRTEPAGDLCCDSAKADRGSDDASGTRILGSDECPCSDYSMSFMAPQVTTTAKIVIPAVETAFLLPSVWVVALIEEQPRADLADHGPPRASPLEHLESVVLRI